MTESVEGITAAKARLNRLRAAVSDLDNRIKELDRRRRAADPREQVVLAHEIRSLGDQRLTAEELLSEAEAQFAAKVGEHDAAVEVAAKNLGRIAKGCLDAAGRFDRALHQAVEALVEIEREAAPLTNTLIPNGMRNYTHPRCINAAIAQAFGERLSRSRHPDQQSMSDRISLMISDARQNAAQLRKKEAA